MGAEYFSLSQFLRNTVESCLISLNASLKTVRDYISVSSTDAISNTSEIFTYAVAASPVFGVSHAKTGSNLPFIGCRVLRAMDMLNHAWKFHNNVENATISLSLVAFAEITHGRVIDIKLDKSPKSRVDRCRLIVEWSMPHINLDTASENTAASFEAKLETSIHAEFEQHNVRDRVVSSHYGYFHSGHVHSLQLSDGLLCIGRDFSDISELQDHFGSSIPPIGYGYVW